MVHDLRAMCDAVAYVVKNGVEWRALPVDFPPWEAVYAFFERWNGRGLPAELVLKPAAPNPGIMAAIRGRCRVPRSRGAGQWPALAAAVQVRLGSRVVRGIVSFGLDGEALFEVCRYEQ
jgi:hypothetical protein